MDGRTLGAWAAAMLALGCTRPAEERARRDLEIGQADVAGTSVTVEGGLAAIRRAAPGELLLWQSAPVTRLRIVRAAGAPDDWTLEVRNALPDLQLEAEHGSAPLTVTAVDRPIVTHKEFRVRLPAGESTLSLTTPDAAEPSAWRFAVMSDVQEAIGEVQDIYQKVNAEPGVRFLLGAGDLTQQGSVSELSRFELELRSLQVPYYTTLGNHELGNTPPPYQDLYGRGSFSFVFREVRFTLLDSASATLDPLVYGWLEGWLAQGKGSVHVVAMHVPPLDPSGLRNGGFGSRAEAAKLLSRLAQGSVDLTLYGHIHSYYGFENAGIPAHVSGGGGAIPERFDDMGRHFLVVDVAASGVSAVRVVRVD
ncbi:MAG: metallophosphoesterase [Polyangiaceae bacterium]|nr:metallophosphoesterase [Polyangiaceae bacterium]